jgi:hypothetical protein
LRRLATLRRLARPNDIAPLWPNFNSFVVVSLPSSAQVFDFALVYFLAANVLKYCGAK